MNSLMQHPVLKNLPYELLKNPTVEGIKAFRDKKLKMFSIFKWGSVGLFFLMLLTVSFPFTMVDGNVALNIPSGANFLLTLVGPIGLAFMFHSLSKKFNLTEEEIVRAVEEFHAQPKVPA